MKHGVADYLVKKNTTPESLCVAIQKVLEETGLLKPYTIETLLRTIQSVV
jgi:uncharacterized Zn finger protein